MSQLLDEIKARIAQEYEKTGQLNAETWLADYPDLQDELAEFFRIIGPALATAADKPVPLWLDPSGTLSRIQENTRRLAEIRSADRGEARLGAAIADADEPGVVVPPQGRDRWKETKTALFTWIVETLRRNRRGNTGRYDANKATYFVERGLRLDLFRGFKPATWGLWNPSLERVEREALQKGWLESPELGRRFDAGPAVDHGVQIARERLTKPDLADELLLHLVRHRLDLELWGMVDYAARQLMSRGEQISVNALVEELKTVKEWEWKDHLHPQVPSALEHLVRLELLPSEMIDFS